MPSAADRQQRGQVISPHRVWLPCWHDIRAGRLGAGAVVTDAPFNPRFGAVLDVLRDYLEDQGDSPAEESGEASRT